MILIMIIIIIIITKMTRIIIINNNNNNINNAFLCNKHRRQKAHKCHYVRPRKYVVKLINNNKQRNCR